jgi:hypothetical protein
MSSLDVDHEKRKEQDDIQRLEMDRVQRRGSFYLELTPEDIGRSEKMLVMVFLVPFGEFEDEKDKGNSMATEWTHTQHTPERVGFNTQLGWTKSTRLARKETIAPHRNWIRST